MENSLSQDVGDGPRVVNTCLAPEEHESVRIAAKLSNMSVKDFCRIAVKLAANSIVNDYAAGSKSERERLRRLKIVSMSRTYHASAEESRRVDAVWKSLKRNAKSGPND